MTSWAASDRTVNTALDAGPQYAWRLALLAGCAALAFGIVACSQTPSGGNVGTTPQGILTENPIDRYLINSHMAPNLARDADGGITLYIQHESPGKNRGAELATRAQGSVLHGAARVLAEARGH